MFIVIEGLPGCDARKLAQTLAPEFGRVAWSCPWEGVIPARRRDMQSFCDTNPLAQMLWEVLTVVTQNAAIRGDIDEGRAVVIDRYWLALAARHQLLGSPCSLSEVAAQLLSPDLTVYLQAPLAVRRERLTARPGSDGQAHWLLDPLDPQISAELDATYRAQFGDPLAGEVIELDATRPTKDLVASIMQKLRQCHPRGGGGGRR